MLGLVVAFAPAVRETTSTPTSRRDAWAQRAVIGAWAGPVFTTLPRTSAIVGGDLTWRFGLLGVQLSGWHAFAIREKRTPGIRASLTGGGARFVVAPRAGPVELPISFGVELGALAGRGVGAVQPRRVQSLWAALAVGFGVAWPAQSRFALAVRADALVGLIRPGIHLETADDGISPFRMPPVGFRVLAGPIVRLP